METNSETVQEPDEQIRMHARPQWHTDTQTQRDNLVNLAKTTWVWFALPVGTTKDKLGYTEICLINVVLPGS